ncbi:MAG: hypothetical protein AAF808_19980 [Cyanobacteria bacterium P01_D01_bin.2]
MTIPLYGTSANVSSGSKFTINLLASSGNNIISSDNNLIHWTGTSTPEYRTNNVKYVGLTQWRPQGFDPNSIEAIDPGFADPANGDFTTTAPEVDTLEAGVEYYVAT